MQLLDGGYVATIVAFCLRGNEFNYRQWTNFHLGGFNCMSKENMFGILCILCIPQTPCTSPPPHLEFPLWLAPLSPSAVTTRGQQREEGAFWSTHWSLPAGSFERGS